MIFEESRTNFHEVNMASKRTLTECMAVIEDPRIERTSFMTCWTFLYCRFWRDVWSGRMEDIEEFGHIRKGWLRKFIKLRNGIPSHDTIARVFRMLKPEEFQAPFTNG